jgi:AraC family transcriptional regulator
MSETKQRITAERQLNPGQYFGEVPRRHHCHGFLLSEIVHRVGKKLPRHTHPLAFFSLLLDGAYAEHIGTKTISYTPLTIGFHPPGLTHDDEIGTGGGRFFNVEIESLWLDRLREIAPLPDVSTDLHGGEMVWLATRLYRECREFDAASPLAIEGLVLEMLATVARARIEEKRPPAWLSRVVDRLHAEFQRPLTVNDLAAEAGIHPFHLSKVFRRFHHQTIGEYLHRLQVHYACNQLATPDLKLADVALAAGFADQAHFTRVFKQLTGITPGAFRKELFAHGDSPRAGCSGPTF